MLLGHARNQRHRPRRFTVATATRGARVRYAAPRPCPPGVDGWGSAMGSMPHLWARKGALVEFHARPGRRLPPTLHRKILRTPHGSCGPAQAVRCSALRAVRSARSWRPPQVTSREPRHSCSDRTTSTPPRWPAGAAAGRRPTPHECGAAARRAPRAHRSSSTLDTSRQPTTYGSPLPRQRGERLLLPPPLQRASGPGEAQGQGWPQATAQRRAAPLTLRPGLLPERERTAAKRPKRACRRSRLRFTPC